METPSLNTITDYLKNLKDNTTRIWNDFYNASRTSRIAEAEIKGSNLRKVQDALDLLQKEGLLRYETVHRRNGEEGDIHSIKIFSYATQIANLVQHLGPKKN